MDVRQTIRSLLVEVSALRQAHIAERSGVNQGQLSNWLHKEGYLSDEKEGRVVKAVLDQLGDLSAKHRENYFAQYPEAVATLRQFEPYRQIEQTSAPSRPGQPLPPGDIAYIQRQADIALQGQLKARPFWISIVGGAKMGKSSLLLRVQQDLRSEFVTLRVDFQDYARLDPTQRPELLTWFSRQIERQMEGLVQTRLTKQAEFPRWVESEVLPNAGTRDCVFLIDHLESLFDHTNPPGKGLLEMVTSVHHFLNSRRSRRNLDRCSFIFATDDTHHLWGQAGSFVSSIIARRTNFVEVGRLPETGVTHLFERLGIEPRDLDKAVRNAWDSFQGHPFLTHAFAMECLCRGCEEASTERAMLALWSDIAACIDQRWPRTLRQVVLDAVRDQNHQINLANQNISLLCSLGNTGLFLPVEVPPERDDMPSQGPVSATVRPISKWIQDRLTEVQPGV
jgi:hypothetical protein